MLEIPAVVREKALAVGADAWLEALPELVRSVELDWRTGARCSQPQTS